MMGVQRGLNFALRNSAFQGFRARLMPIQDIRPSDDAFTLERHGDPTVITANASRLSGSSSAWKNRSPSWILKSLRRQENPLNCVRLEPGRQLWLDVSGGS